jgi:DNA-binding MarR family transcriptional regulator
MDQRRFNDPRDQTDASRTVTLTGRDLRDATRLLRTLVDTVERQTPSPRPAAFRDRNGFLECAREILRLRRSRTQYFGSAMFGEPGWDILLILYVEEGRNQLHVSRLMAASGSPPTTGLRWLDYLESQQWVGRRKHPTDGRVELVELTDKGRGLLDSYFSETLTKAK